MRGACALLALILITAPAPRAADALLNQIDHLVYATPDLTLGIDTAEKLFRVRATPGGQHPREGTRNALISLGPTSYFEIIGPDPDQPKPERGRRFRIDEIKAPVLTTWVAKGSGLERFASRTAAQGVNLGAVISGSRKRPDGVVLSWRYTDPRTILADRLIPYFIDWGSSPHPSATAAKGVTLVSLRAEHPDAGRVRQMLDVLGLNLAVTSGSKAALIATFDSPKGKVELRSQN
jgi:glyoxalase-like protein